MVNVYCHWPKLCIDDDASIYILVLILIFYYPIYIYVRQPFSASLAVKELEKKIGPGGI